MNPSALAVAVSTAIAVASASPLPYGKLFTDGPRRVKQVALTFDDGPGPVTPSLLDLLKERGVHATFFVVGKNVRLHPGIVKRMVAEGHQVALHSDTHRDFSKVTEDKRVAALEGEIDASRASTEAETGAPVHFMRMPYGYDRPWVKEVARRKEIVLANWTYGSDWKKLPEEEMTLEYQRYLHGGAILLMHDGGVRGGPRVVRVTKALLDAMKEKKLEPVRLDVLLGLGD